MKIFITVSLSSEIHSCARLLAFGALDDDGGTFRMESLHAMCRMRNTSWRVQTLRVIRAESCSVEP